MIIVLNVDAASQTDGHKQFYMVQYIRNTYVQNVTEGHLIDLTDGYLVFEIVSGYGTVGLSLGIPTVRAFCSPGCD